MLRETRTYWYLSLLIFLSATTLCAQNPAPSGIQFKHITVDEGLSHNHVTSILKSSDGFLWIGTPAGLNRFDGQSIKVFKNQSGNFESLKDNSVTSILEGPNGNLWIRTALGINFFDTRKDIFVANTDSLLESIGILPGNISDIQKDKSGNYWFLHASGNLYKYTPEKKAIRYKSKLNTKATGISSGNKNNLWVVYEDGSLESLNTITLETQVVKKLPVSLSENYELRIFIDKLEDPWIYTANKPSGIYWWPDFSSPPLHFSTGSSSLKLNNNIVRGIVQDLNGRIWIATDHGGINLLDSRSQKVSYLVHEDYNERSLNHNGTSTLICDSDGMVWVGTYKGGVSYYHENLVQFPVVKHHRNVAGSLPYDDINRLVEDKNGNLWIGTNGGGLIFYDKTFKTYTQYQHSPEDPESLGSNVVVSMLLDKDDNLWVGTYHGGLNLFRNGKFLRFTHDAKNPRSISDNSVWEIFQDSRERIWVGTLAGGINLFDPATGIFTKPGRESGPAASYICSVMEDRKGNIWFGTATGIEVLGPKGITKYTYNAQNKHSLSNDYISDLLQDSKGRIWVATHDGLNLFDPETNGFEVIKETDGLKDNTIHTLLEDDAGKLWLSTPKGISVISRSDDWIIRNFDKHDGLQSVAFNENAAVKLKSGELLFGGPMGFNRINPDDISQEKLFPKPVIVDLLVFNRSVKPGELVNGRRILKEAVQYSEKIILGHDQNVFSLNISPLYFLHPERVKIKYNLEGFSKEWLELDAKSRLATFTNLNAGEYVFRVIVSTDGEEWSEPENLMKIKIKPPFWLSGWAYGFYALSLCGLLFATRYIERRRQYTRFLIQQEREEAKRIKELDQLKTRFFTNVSHEFRTPVSLIISPVEKLVNTEQDLSRKKHLQLVQRNARRLLNLVNQLLDFRKIDTNSLQVFNTEGDILSQVRDHAGSFQDMAESKEIEYRVEIPDVQIFCFFDHDKLERVLFNLLSNAFKFTPVNGKISLIVTVEKLKSDGKFRLNLTVEDNGIGISEEAKTKIFDRYYQGDLIKPLLNQGSGIGLAITKEYVSLMGGTLRLESELNKGSRFSITFPVDEKEQGITVGQTILPTVKPETKPAFSGGKVLIVEDNEDFRFYLMDNIKEHYQADEARNFSEGWEKALAFHPDLIVSDVNMPGNTGIELCKKLKSDSRTLHIPVILLTALSAENHQLEGIEAGAADYIVKPFNVELLLSKIKSHIKQKSSLEKTYRKQLTVDPTEMELESVDEKFMRKALEVVEKNISNSLFSVELLADEMNVSRVGLYKKILTLCGYSPSEFIRNIRLKRAARLLEETGITVAEVAYEVGFNNPKVFSKYFKDIFGKLPSEYRKRAD